jgi:hypothetical protein
MGAEHKAHPEEAYHEYPEESLVFDIVRRYFNISLIGDESFFLIFLFFFPIRSERLLTHFFRSSPEKEKYYRASNGYDYYTNVAVGYPPTVICYEAVYYGGED